mgnify:FL=1
MLPDIKIARQTDLLPIDVVAAKLGIDSEHLEHYGCAKAKISQDYCHSLTDNDTGKLILVSAINPTPAGEGKTTTTIGLGDALNRIGKRTTICLREPSLGPCFGMKGGGAGGGHAQIAPMEDINLHFTGDIHAVSTAHNLLAAALDNYIHHGNARGIDLRRIAWNRVIDMNDRALRGIVVGLGGTANSFPRESGFDIAVASEVMAILCLSESLGELKERLGKIVVAQTRSRETVRAEDLNVHGAMAALLKDACKPNLVQTLEGNPALVHGGPFANIAHGCNSITATRLAMRLSEYTVTEAGFGADLGAEKFCNIKCRQTGLDPDLVVLVATVRALKFHGGISLKKIAEANVTGVEKGVDNLKKHIENIRRFGLPAVVAVNTFASDTEAEIECIRDKVADLGVEIVAANHHAHGGAGAEDLARTVVTVAENTQSVFKPLYPDDMNLWDKVRTIAQEIYGADDIMGDTQLRGKFRRLEEEGYGHLPVCMAKTQYSLSTDPGLKGRPRGFNVPLRDVKVSAGAGFVVVSTGDIMTMPGLPKTPSAESIDIDDQGQITGLF